LAWCVAIQVEAFGPLEKVPDGGGVPTCAASRRALAHGLELSCNLLQRAIRRGSSDVRDQPNEAIIP
jgi:hypothetical protein